MICPYCHQDTQLNLQRNGGDLITHCDHCRNTQFASTSKYRIMQKQTAVIPEPPTYYTTTEKAFLIVAFLLIFLFGFVIMGSADTALIGKITRASYTRPQPDQTMSRQIKALLEAGFELSWTEPEPHGDWIWFKTPTLPWVRLHREDERESKTLQAILKL